MHVELRNNFCTFANTQITRESMEVIARIDTSTPAGRKALRKISSIKEGVTLEFPSPDYSLENLEDNVVRVFEKLAQRLNEHYSTKYELK